MALKKMINFYAAEAAEHANKNKTLKIHPQCDIESYTAPIFFEALGSMSEQPS